MSRQSWFRRLGASFSYVGLVVAALCFSASLSPSLLPRHYIVQGLLSGLALAVGYGLGVLVVWLWCYLELRPPGAKIERVVKRLTTVGVALVVLLALWRATVWQNSIRELMEMQPLQSAYAPYVALIAVVFGAIVIGSARVFAKSCNLVDRQLKRLLPRRISYVLSATVVGLILLTVANKLIAKQALIAADAVFLEIDGLVDDGIEQPTDARASGSAESLIAWDSIGRQGKDFIVTGPTAEQLKQFSGREALRPLRVYVGLGSRDSEHERAQLALKELRRVGGFDRSVLVVATPTGTGWLDPGAVDTLEFLHAGDTAIVSMQYSYLPSWITILVDPNRSRDSARILFDAIYGHWKTLPQDSRPRLYLHGLSLGALGSETCADLFTLFEDPIQGGVFSGPPFPSTEWAAVTQGRNPDSPAWLPTFRDGTMVRFTGKENSLDQAGERWGPMRFVYVQHASDPMTFFAPELLLQEPDWLAGKRGPDVSPYLRWYPIVTFLQIAFDLPMATSIPTGYGHNYAPASYINAWIEVTEPAEWRAGDTERLKQLFAE
ncbi:MAG: alpha/beta-hydrolase family protein [Candidatus Nealsonbacteria bacterium]|nr:alpha/beta-hydrolase family protein [Candidatus Nealsonbacteria bacterium]